MRRIVFSGFILMIVIVGLLGGCINTPSKNDDDSAVEAIENYHVYIAFGQSNMQGPGEIRPQDREDLGGRYRTLNVVPGVYAGEYRAKGEWYNAVPPLIIPDSNLTNYLGLRIGLSPADYFGRTLVNGVPEHITIGVIAVANGDMALAAFHKTKAENYYKGTGTLAGRPSSTEMQGMSRYKGAGYANMYDAIIQNAKLAQRAGGVIKGIIVHQGESGTGLDDIDWVDLLKEIYDDMLSDLKLQPNSIPILLGQTWNGGSGRTGGALSNDRVIQEVLPNAWIISSKDCTGRTGQGQPDNIHFGSAGLQLLGTRYGEKMLELVY
jgi:hypothetical protein